MPNSPLPRLTPILPQPQSQNLPLPMVFAVSSVAQPAIVALPSRSPVAVTTVEVLLPAGYSNATLKGQVRSAAAGVADDLYIQFNRDTTANYVWQQIFGNNNVASSAQNNVAATTQPLMARVAGATAPASHASNFQIDIENYSGGVFVHEAISFGTEYDGFGAANQAFIICRGIRWGASTPIFSVTLGLVTGPYAAGSVIRPYVWI